MSANATLAPVHAGIESLAEGFGMVRAEALELVNFPEGLQFRMESLAIYMRDARIGAWDIQLPERYTSHSASYDALIADFSVDGFDMDEGSGHRLYIPAHQVTRATGLAGGVGAGGYEPVLDISVTTSSDRPITTIDSQSGWTEQPSPGKWYRLPLRHTEISLIPVAE